MKIKNSLNAAFFQEHEVGEVNAKPKLTIPDQTLPISVIVDRYARGIPMETYTPIYTGEDDDMPDWRKMDLAEIQVFREELQDIADRQKARIEEKRKEAAQNAAKDKEDAIEYRKWKEAQNQAKNAQSGEQPEMH